MSRYGYFKPVCPDCQSENLVHVLHSAQHECNECGKEFVADCNPHLHAVSTDVAKYDGRFRKRLID